MKKIKVSFLLVFLLFTSFNPISAQDSLLMSIDKTEEFFLKKNLLLLASKCNVDKQTALLIQSKSYPNPYFTANFNVYDPENKLYFHTDKTGQKDFMIEQLIILGGKRKVNIEMARSNKAIAEAELADLLRNLRLQLHKSFYTIYQYQNNISKFNRQLVLLDTLIRSYELQSEKGNISLKDVIRLKSIYLKINNEKAIEFQLLNQENKNISLLLQERAVFVPEIRPESIEDYDKQHSLDELQSAALKMRPDLLMDESYLKLAELNYVYQKKSVIPDASVNLSTDQRGGAFRNQVNAGVSVPLPLWNYNRGNIKAAKYEIDQADLLLERRKQEIKAEVLEAFQNMQRSVAEYAKAKRLHGSDFDKVFASVSENFTKRNITIIEFADFLEAYNDALKELERIKSQIAINAATMNYVTASKLY